MPTASFSWKNYTKPTPRNLLIFATYMRDFVTFASITFALNHYPWVAVGIQIAGFVLDKLKHFFSMVEEDTKMESVTAVMPESGKEITVTQEIPKGVLDSGEQEI